MNKNYTTIEQSMRLKDLGLGPETADMAYFAKPDDWKIGKFDGYCERPDLCNGSVEPCEEPNLPCWSVGALINVMPEHIEEMKDHPLDLWIAHRGVWYIDETGLQHGPCFSGDLIDACFKMVEWLLKTNKIEGITIETNEQYEAEYKEYGAENPDFLKYLTDSTVYEMVDWYDMKHGTRKNEEDGGSDEAYDFAKYVWVKILGLEW